MDALGAQPNGRSFSTSDRAALLALSRRTGSVVERMTVPGTCAQDSRRPLHFRHLAVGVVGNLPVEKHHYRSDALWLSNVSWAGRTGCATGT